MESERRMYKLYNHYKNVFRSTIKLPGLILKLKFKVTTCPFISVATTVVLCFPTGNSEERIISKVKLQGISCPPLKEHWKVLSRLAGLGLHLNAVLPVNSVVEQST